MQGGCRASCFWFPQECLGYWIKGAEFCEEKAGFGSLMTASIDFFFVGVKEISHFAFVGL